MSVYRTRENRGWGNKKLEIGERDGKRKARLRVVKTATFVPAVWMK